MSSGVSSSTAYEWLKQMPRFFREGRIIRASRSALRRDSLEREVNNREFNEP